MSRSVKAELLDSLDPKDPDAIASRRDLRLINRFMGNYTWFESVFCPQCVARNHCLEIGAGGGELAIRIIRKACCSTYTAIDLAPAPEDWPESAFWHRGDLFQYPGYHTAEVLLANLVLHHFTDEQLTQIGKRISNSSIHKIVANEPCRRPAHKMQLRLGKLVGFNHVTLHDGCISIDAGFREDELPQRLGLDQKIWYWKIEETLMGAYRMVAERR